MIRKHLQYWKACRTQFEIIQITEASVGLQFITPSKFLEASLISRSKRDLGGQAIFHYYGKERKEKQKEGYV